MMCTWVFVNNWNITYDFVNSTVYGIILIKFNFEVSLCEGLQYVCALRNTVFIKNWKNKIAFVFYVYNKKLNY